MKLLLISYYFPPCGGAAVQRWLRFINALDRRGVKVTVVTTREGDYPYTDYSLFDKLPTGIRVLRSKPFGFGSLWRFLGQKELPYGSLKSRHNDSLLKRTLYWLRLNLIVPDLRIGWNSSAYKLAKAELLKNNYTAVITTGPPHSTHLIGLKLKKNLRIKWCTDFRDPWSEIYYLKLTPPLSLTLNLHKYMERKVIASADLNFIVSRSIADSLPAGIKEVLYNGFDADDFALLSYRRSEKFRIKFVGQLTAGQDATQLLNALVELKEYKDLQLSLIGTRYFPESKVDLRKVPFLPHREALNELVNAELLVLFINSYEGNKGMLTTKLFEYIASRSPILCVATSGGEAEEIITQSVSGVVLQNKEDITLHIIKLYKAWQDGSDLRQNGDISTWDVDNQVNKLLQIR